MKWLFNDGVMKGNCMYFIPCTLSNNTNLDVIPQAVVNAAESCTCFIVENLRSARRFLRAIGFTGNFNTIPFFELNKEYDSSGLYNFIKQHVEQHTIGVVSEAGCPGVADPGSEVAAVAHRLGIRVIPLVGPSSILLTLMSSGFNGQNFAFNGYLPIDKQACSQKIQALENLIYTKNQTQLFIETPYRNNQLLQLIIQQCRPQTQLCIASELTLPNEYIATKTIDQWKHEEINLHKKMVVFAMYKQ